MSLRFNGATYYKSPVDNARYGTQLGECTFSCWVAPGALDGNSQICMAVGESFGSTTYDKQLGIAADSATSIAVGWYIYDGGSKNINVSLPNAMGPTSDPIKWIHLAASCGDAANLQRLYFDGVLVATNPAGRSYEAFTTASLFIGGFRSYYCQNGTRIAYPSVWRVALTSGEILALARGVRPETIRPRDCVAAYPCLERNIEQNLMSNDRLLLGAGAVVQGINPAIRPLPQLGARL